MTPMPPPKASTEGPRDRHVHHEIGQLVRALQGQGPQRPDELADGAALPLGACPQRVVQLVREVLHLQVRHGMTIACLWVAAGMLSVDGQVSGIV